MNASGSKIPTGQSYLFTRAAVPAAYELLRHLLVKGHRGLILSRTHPEKISILYDVDCPAIWLVSKLPSKGKFITVDPQRLSRIYSLIGDFARNNPGAAILMDGVEYLISENDFSSVMKTIQLINETIAITKSIFLLPIDPKSIDPQELGFLEREIPPLDRDFFALEMLEGDKSF